MIEHLINTKLAKAKSSSFKNASRVQTSLLSPLEKIVLSWLAGHMPKWVTPDKLSILGFASMILAGIFYYLSKYNPHLLHFVNIALALNWFGDSLDGTLARYRHIERPRYGFYVDHIIDTFGTFFLIGGLALSGYMSERVALILIIVYFMLAINSYLAAYTIGVFSISFWKCSPTEIRIALAIGNIALIYHPFTKIFGQAYLLYDVGGVISIAAMFIMLIVSSIKNIYLLYKLEPNK
jgi:archaetidylinositol phosphate synthase